MTHVVVDGYINESGKINTKRLQVVLDEMAVWERDVFEKEYSDMNWYKGKQPKHVKEMELARKRNQLGLSRLNLLIESTLTPPCSAYHCTTGDF